MSLSRASIVFAALVPLGVGCSERALPTHQTSPSSSARLDLATGAPAAIVSRLDANVCADVTGAGTDAGARIIIWSCHGGANQQFAWQPGGEIRVYGELCVDAYGARGEDHDPIVIWPCNGQDNQKWWRTEAGEIRGVAGKCIDVLGADASAGTPLILHACHGGRNQQWDSPDAPAPPPSPPEGNYVEIYPGDDIQAAVDRNP